MLVSYNLSCSGQRHKTNAYLTFTPLHVLSVSPRYVPREEKVMLEYKIIRAVIVCLVFCCTAGYAQNYTNCTGDIKYIGDGYCDLGNNNELCGYDGGKILLQTLYNSRWCERELLQTLFHRRRDRSITL